MSTRRLHSWEIVLPTDTYDGQTVGEELSGVQAEQFLFPVTRELTIELTVREARALHAVYSWPVTADDKTLADLVAEAEARS